MAERIAWIDVARGLGIIAVVSGHVLIDPAIDNPIGRFIYLFHMPYFFLLSGMLQRTEPALDTLAKRSSALLRPYLFYLVVLSIPLFKTDLSHLHHHHSVATSPLLDLMFGGQWLTGDFGVFWFVTCLFFAQVAFAFLRERLALFDWRMIATMCVMAAVGYTLASLNLVLPWAIGIAPFAIVLLWAGAALGRMQLRPASYVWVAGASVFLLVAIISATGQSPSFDMKAYDYGLPVAGALLAIGLSVAFFGVSRALSQFAAAREGLSFLGRASLTIMFLHQFVHIRLAHYVSQPVVLIVVSLAVPAVIHYGLSKWQPTRYLALGQPGWRPVMTISRA